jgi:hypothetical protein
MRSILGFLLVLMLACQSMANERMFIGFDAQTQKMHAVLVADEPVYALIDFDYSAGGCGPIETYDPNTLGYVPGDAVSGETHHWCQATLYTDPEATGQVTIEVRAHYFLDPNFEVLDYTSDPVVDVLSIAGEGDGSYYVYQDGGCVPILPPSIPINSSFCATICHGAFFIPIECEDPNYTPDLVEVTVSNGCHPDETQCEDPDCPTIDWSLFSYQIFVFPGCNLFLSMAYCGQNGGCICIWRSDFILPVEVNSFTAVAGDESVRLNWSTGAESNLESFRISRSETRDGNYVGVAMNIPATNNTTGDTYSWTDETVANGRTYYYKLHVVEQDGGISVYDQVAEATPRTGLSSPAEFALEQNYPNPFNSETSFSFSLPMDEHVTLTVFDLLGREVATVIDSDMPAAHHTINWSATGLSTGVYMYTLTAGEFSQTKKLLYLK